MNIAVEGCLHGELQRVYEQLLETQKKSGVKIDALLICGDFQAIRNHEDLDYMHCPPKYKQMGGFHKYHSGQKIAPFLTIFIGGNHQAVNYMRDLYFGGWAAPNIYFLGQAGSIYLKKGSQKIRISGLSGIYHHRDFKYALKTERIPLYGKDRIVAYHLKQLQTLRMQIFSRICTMKIEDPENYGKQQANFDIFLSHDWPQDITFYGDLNDLLRKKGFLRDQIQNHTLGSAPLTRLMKIMKPSYWFSAHMHVKFAALYPHPGNKYTHFLSLDKCLQKRPCMQLLHLGSDHPNQLQKISISHDETWLWVVRHTANLQKQNRSYYKYNQSTLTVTNPSVINDLIKKYSQQFKQKQTEPLFKQQQLNLINKGMRDVIKQIEQNKYVGGEFEGQQISQTVHLLQNILKVDLKYFQGVIFPVLDKKSQMLDEINEQFIQQKQQGQPINDQIDLDL